MHLERKRACSKDVDRVYGLLGLSESLDSQDELLKSGVIHYDREYWHTYIAYTTFVLQKDPNILTLAPASKKHPLIPSWCRDWTKAYSVEPFYPSAFRAGFGLCDVYKPRAMVDRLCLNSLRFGRVDKVIDVFTVGAYCRECQPDRIESLKEIICVNHKRPIPFTEKPVLPELEQGWSYEENTSALLKWENCCARLSQEVLGLVEKKGEVAEVSSRVLTADDFRCRVGQG